MQTGIALVDNATFNQVSASLSSYLSSRVVRLQRQIRRWNIVFFSCFQI